jgi:hypothetical protein
LRIEAVRKAVEREVKKAVENTVVAEQWRNRERERADQALM